MERKDDFNFKHVTRDEIFKATWIFVTKTWICATNDSNGFNIFQNARRVFGREMLEE